jgi:hypothetical protein
LDKRKKPSADIKRLRIKAGGFNTDYRSAGQCQEGCVAGRHRLINSASIGSLVFYISFEIGGFAVIKYSGVLE